MHNRQKPSEIINYGEMKRKIYASAQRALKVALQNHGWLEAIAIEESIISDKIESYIARYFDIHKLCTLEGNIKHLKKYPVMTRELQELTRLLEAWKDERNYALHQLVKVEAGDNLSWEDRMARVESAAKDGFVLVGKVTSWARKIPK